uniref:Uncharacterized protein n=1 Tax=Cynoglossus semilaevis TaxID=244447 RepID=A0A3P8UTW9_CYNSE
MVLVYSTVRADSLYVFCLSSGHFCTYKERFISLYCRLSSVLDLDALITQQALREAITDSEVVTAKQRHQLVLDYIQQLDEMRRDLRWITDALQYARYKHPSGGVPITCLVDANSPENSSSQQKTDSTSSTMDYLATPSPSPELRRRKAINDTLLGSDEDGSSEVFLPTDSDYDSSDALSPRELDLLYSPSQGFSQQAVHTLGGSAPDVLQVHELRALPSSPSLPLSPTLSKDLPLSLPLSPTLTDTTRTLEGLSLSKEDTIPSPRVLPNPPAKRKLLSRSHRGQYFSGPQRWLRGHSGEDHTGSLSEGIYTKQFDLDRPTPEDSTLTSTAQISSTTYVSHASCVLENRRSRHREHRPHVRRIFVEPCRKSSETEVLGGATAQDVDSDDQTNSQVSEILSSTL